MTLATIPYYRIPRSDDGRVNREYERQFEMGLRWRPDGGFADDDARSILGRLRGGDEVSARHLALAVEYLNAAIAFYSEPGLVEPYPRRNAEAVADLRALRGLLGGWP